MTAVVIGANIALALVIPLPYSSEVDRRMRQWHDEDLRFAVPALWGYEVVSGLRKAVVKGILTTEAAERAIQFLWALGLDQIPATPESHVKALAWAERLGQTVAYDAQYILVAETLGATLWTADRKLWQAAQDAGAAWVRWIGGSA